MKKGILFLTLLLMVSIGGCAQDEDLTDTITTGTWKVGYFISDRDEHTALFNNYVFTFLLDGTVTVIRPGLPTATGSWNGFDHDTRFDLDFNEPGPLNKLNVSWVIDRVKDDEVLLHELSYPFNQFHLNQR